MRGPKLGVVVLTMSAWGAFVSASPPLAPRLEPQPAAGSSERAPAPPPPRELLKTGARLFNKGLYEAAAKYFDAAHRAQDKLTPSEQVVLHVYIDELDKYEKKTYPPHADPALITASATDVRSSAPERAAATSKAAAPPGGRTADAPTDRAVTPTSGPTVLPLELAPIAAAASRGETTDVKQKARWKLQQAREQIFVGHPEEAAKLLAEVRAMNLKWGFFDDTPDKVAKALDAARARGGPGRLPPSARPLGIPSAFPTSRPTEAKPK